MGLEVYSILGTAYERGAHPSPLAALSFPDLKEVPIYHWVNRQSFPVVRSMVQTHNSLLSHSNPLTTAPLRICEVCANVIGK